MWRKFILKCACIVVAAYYQAFIDGALSQAQGKKKFRTLLQEAYEVGKATGVPLPDEVVDDQYRRVMGSNDIGVTSSLERDITASHQSELDTLSGATHPPGPSVWRARTQVGKMLPGVSVKAPLRAPQTAYQTLNFTRSSRGDF
jgi:Ketopantoate reductase